MRHKNQYQDEQERMGPAGRCICPKCGMTTQHQRGVRCQELSCPECGAKMLRENSYHHQLFQKKHGSQDS